VLGVEEIHVVVLNSVTLMPKSIANYLKQLKLLGFLELKGTGFFFTDRLIEKGKGLHEQKVSDLQPKPEKEKPKFVDETGLPKY
jgi:predicted nucleic acid-binding Zn ribbon protein